MVCFELMLSISKNCGGKAAEIYDSKEPLMMTNMVNFGKMVLEILKI